MRVHPRCTLLPGAVTCPHLVGPPHLASHRIVLDEQSSTLTHRRKASSFMNSIFLKTPPLLLAAGLALSGASAAHAQSNSEFSFTTPTTSTLLVHPGDTINFSGTVTNDTQLEQIDSVTISAVTAVPGNFTGFSFFSPFFADIADGETLNFTGTLKVSPTANFTPTFFYLDANGNGDQSGDSEDLTSNDFKVVLVPAAVPEASSLVSTGILLTLGLGAFALRSRKRSAEKLG